MSPTLVISRMFPPAVGGNGRWMWELYSRLPRGEFLVAADKSCGCEEFDRSHDLPMIRLPLRLDSWGALGWRRGAAYYRVYAALRRLVRARGIESVHASNCLPEGFLAWLLHRRFGLPYVVYVHGEELNIAGKSRELRWMAGRVFRDAALVIANSRNTARLLRQDWPSAGDRVRVMHPGVDTDVFRPAPRDQDKRREFGWGDRPVILTVGRLQQRKGQEQIIRALPEIRRQVPNVLYAIVGEGAERGRLEQLTAELGLQDCVRLHGEMQHDDLLAAYQQCDVFAMPNREVAGDFEGFGIVYLEAQACGKPVIAGDSGGTAEAIHAPETGFIVRQDHPDDLPQRLVQLLGDDALRERMGQAGRAWVVANFNWQTLTAQASQLFSAHFDRRVESCPIEVAAAEPSC
jgi:phosphatidylinositol alpha-1,6-mannosyltransferase